MRCGLRRLGDWHLRQGLLGVPVAFPTTEYDRCDNRYAAAGKDGRGCLKTTHAWLKQRLFPSSPWFPFAAGTGREDSQHGVFVESKQKRDSFRRRIIA